MPIEIPAHPAPTQAPASGAPWRLALPRRRRVTARDRMFFLERLSLLLEMGVPLHQALEALGRQVHAPALREVIAELLETIAGGGSFSSGLARHPRVFSTTHVHLAAAGEAGGFLPEVLAQLLRMEEKNEQLRSTLASALSYPAFLAFFSAAVVVFILVVVFPKFAELFGAIRDRLPFTTLALMATSELVCRYWIALLAATAGGLAGLVRWLRRPEALALLDRAKLSLPVVRDVCAQLYLAQTLRVLGLSLANGVNVLDALAACRDVVKNRVFRRFLDGVEESVKDGRGVAGAFEAAPFVPPIVGQMMSTGEQTGTLALVMGRVADFYERELEKKVKALSKMAEPVMLLVMGAVVGLLVSSLILPIFQLSRATQ